MKPLEYHAPTSLDEAFHLLSNGGPGAAPLAGGTDLIIQNRSGRKEVTDMVDLKRIAELNIMEFNPQSGMRLGAAVACAALAGCEPLVKHYPGLVEGAELIGSTQIQSRASVGGNVCNGSPAADTICALIALEAICIVQSASGTREVAAKDFMTGPGKTVLQPGELLIEMRLPPPAPRSGNGYLRFIPRNEMDIAVASAAAYVELGDDKQTCTAARIVIGAVAPTPLLVEAAGQALVGSKLDKAAIEAAAQASDAAARPIDDMRGTAVYRHHMAGVLTKRAIGMALERIKENG